MILNTPDPLLVALIAKLPAAEEGFTTGDRERWIAAMDAALQFLYPPEWSQEARKRARAGPGVEMTIAGVSAPDVAEALRAAKAKREAADHFPTITAPPGGVILAGPVEEPVLVIPPAKKPTTQEILNAALTLVDAETDIWEAPSTTSADAVDDATSPDHGGKTTTGAADADGTSPGLPVGPDSEPSTPSSGVPAPVPPPEPGRKRHFTADQKGAILRRVVREGMPAVQADLLIHESTLNRWVREMPKAVERYTVEWEAEQREEALVEGGPTVAELEAEQERPVPPRPAVDPPPQSKPVVQWPTAPIEHRPIVDHEAVRRRSAEGV